MASHLVWEVLAVTLKRLGIFGGAFDPIHLGHLVEAEQCREQGQLDQVWFLPTGQPPHKPNRVLTPAAARIDMLEFAIAGCPQFRVEPWETRRNAVSYTIDTLTWLESQNIAEELWLLAGADSLRDFLTWKDPEQILRKARLLVVNRGGQPAPSLNHLVERFGEFVHDRVLVITMPALDISSSDLRARAAAGHSLRFLVPRSVEIYIQQHGLYR